MMKAIFMVHLSTQKRQSVFLVDLPVACGLVDFAIGTDSAGSTRVPVTHCGILGMRPTIHRISESGILSFTPSTSTVGVFAKNLTVLENVISVLLANNESVQRPIGTIYLLEDAFNA